MVLRFVVPKADEAPIWNFSPTVPALSLHHPVKMEPVVGLEPTTDGLQNRCSTTELNWLTYCKSMHYVSNFHVLPSHCILNLYMVAFFHHEKGLTVTDQAQARRGFRLAQDTLPQSHPLQTQRQLFWACPGQWQVDSTFTQNPRVERCQTQAFGFPSGS